MNDNDLFPLLEDALRTQVVSRCRRAYHHDMKNGLQGIYGGVDALIRAARADKPMVIPLDQLVQFVRQAISNHEAGLEGVLNHIAPEGDPSVEINLAELMVELARFLIADASRHSVKLRSELSIPLVTQGNAARLRLAFLALLTEAIDSVGTGGEIFVRGEASETQVTIVIADTRPPGVDAADVFALNLGSDRSGDRLVLPTVRYIVASSGGSVDCVHLPQSGRETRIRFPQS